MAQEIIPPGTSSHCILRLREPPDCSDFFGMRSWVMCYAQWVNVKEKKMDLSTAITDAWSQARRQCKIG
jgi:hypothetical protein